MAFDTRSVRIGIFAMFLIALLVSGLASVSLAVDDYRLGPGDQITIIIPGLESDPLSSVEIQIRPDGKISYPYAGEIMASGLTPEGLSQTIVTAIKSVYKNPRVSVMVRKSASNTFTIGGEVRNAGTYELLPGMRIKDAIAKGNGLTESADTSTAILVRRNQTTGDQTTVQVDLNAILKNNDISKEIELQPGDSLNIGIAMVSVLEQVKSSGNFPLRQADSLAAAIAKAGGLTDKADFNGAYIERGGQKIPVNLKALIVDKDQTANVPLMGGDIVHVPQSRLKVNIFGVAKPGAYELVEGVQDHLMDIITEAGGPVQDARLNRVKVIRMLPDNTKKEMRLDLTKGDPSTNIQLVAGDYIQIEKKKKKFADSSTLLSLGISLFWVLRSITGSN